MDSSPLLRLYPPPCEQTPPTGCYLDQSLVPAGWQGLFLYANFVSSLDGRIAVVDPANGRESVPRDIANPRDWRLFQELAGHAEVVITSGRYLRQFAAGTAQDVLPVGQAAAFSDILEHRLRRGMRPQPDVAVISASLDFEVPTLFRDQRRRVVVLTTSQANEARVRARRAEGAEVLRAGGAGRLDGDRVAQALVELGYATAYCVTGPYVLNTLLAANRLDCLFLTTVHRLIGSADYSSVNEGAAIQPPADFHLTSLYLDPDGAHGVGQQLARFDRVRRG